jgi:hypothetical protein
VIVRGSAKAMVAALSAAVVAACSHGDKIDVLRDALAQGDAAAVTKATRDAPGCARVTEAGSRAPESCLGEIATWLGSKTGFHFDPPDQAAAATAAIAVAREGRGEWLPAPEAWLATVRAGTGPGADALRFAMARAITESATSLAVPVATEGDARALMSAVARSVPGACDTYARLGEGIDPEAGPPERTADHSPCVQQDLERKGGPREHGRYSAGVWRAAMGASALWKDAIAALNEGVAHAPESDRAKLAARVGDAETLLAKVVVQPPEAAAPSPYIAQLEAMHADAGAVAVPAPRPRAGAANDAGLR